MQKKILVNFKSKSVKDYWTDGQYQHNKVIVEIQDTDSQEDIQLIASQKVEEIIDLLYPLSGGTGYDSCYQYEIKSIDLNPYIKRGR